MRMQGIESADRVITDNFLAVPALITASGRVALLQRRLVQGLVPITGLRASPCPFTAGPLVEAIWWHPTVDDHPEHAYLRDAVARACASVT
jgi:DNA-binding transcriptional LysR family regulator